MVMATRKASEHYPYDRWEQDYHNLVDGLSAMPFRGGKGYHWTSKSAAKKIMRQGLGTKNFGVEEHVAYPLFLDLPQKEQERIFDKFEGNSFSSSNNAWVREVEKASKKAGYYMSWLATKPASTSSWGDVCIEVDMEGVESLGWGIMIDDFAFGYGVIMAKKIPPKYLRICGEGKTASDDYEYLEDAEDLLSGVGRFLVRKLRGKYKDRFRSRVETDWEGDSVILNVGTRDFSVEVEAVFRGGRLRGSTIYLVSGHKRFKRGFIRGKYPTVRTIMDFLEGKRS